jgi:hypothetical protein
VQGEQEQFGPEILTGMAIKHLPSEHLIQLLSKNNNKNSRKVGYFAIHRRNKNLYQSLRR